jgi:hypothetical protein
MGTANIVTVCDPILIWDIDVRDDSIDNVILDIELGYLLTFAAKPWPTTTEARGTH